VTAVTPGTPDHQSLIDVYAKHPLREETILARILRQRGTLDGISEIDLAHDTAGEITDQNHIGGIAAVVQLALAAGVTAASRVLDCGAGLGGSARCLAYFFGCRVDGVELSPLRSAEANRLTDRVGLGDLVACRPGDILSVEIPSGHYDVVWGQGAWNHLADTAALFDLASRALVPGGRIAFEDASLVSAPKTDAEAAALAELERLWGGTVRSPEAWQAAYGRAGFRTIAIDDLTGAFVGYYERLQAIARAAGEAAYPAHETRAFEQAITLAGANVIGYTRFVAAAAEE
jgi:cyclopropane fatty-acyl-phospholipid synthase-like methyltransferase